VRLLRPFGHVFWYTFGGELRLSCAAAPVLVVSVVVGVFHLFLALTFGTLAPTTRYVTHTFFASFRVGGAPYNVTSITRYGSTNFSLWGGQIFPWTTRLIRSRACGFEAFSFIHPPRIPCVFVHLQ